MTIPGFTAEASLYRKSKNYRTSTSNSISIVGRRAISPMGTNTVIPEDCDCCCQMYGSNSTCSGTCVLGNCAGICTFS